MDLFTHVLIAYLLTFGLTGPNPSYLAAGALAGGLPDADALFFPLARRFPILRHHGITHSLFGVTIVALVGAVVAPFLAPGSTIVYFLVMEAGGGAKRRRRVCQSHAERSQLPRCQLPELLSCRFA